MRCIILDDKNEAAGARVYEAQQDLTFGSAVSVNNDIGNDFLKTEIACELNSFRDPVCGGQTFNPGRDLCYLRNIRLQ